MYDLPEELFPYLGVLKCAIGLMDTDKHTYNDLFDEINIHTGGIAYGTVINVPVTDYKKSNLYFSVKTKMFYGEIKAAVDLISEILFETKYGDTKRLKDILNEAKSRLEAGAVNSGHAVAMGRALSYYSAGYAKEEVIHGIDFLRLIQSLCENFEDKKDEIVDKLERLVRCIFRPEKLLVDVTGTKELFESIEPIISEFRSKLFTSPYSGNIFVPNVSKKNEGFETAGQVQYVARAGNYRDAGLEYTGALRVLKTIMSYDYLWNNVRVLGGAYGAMNFFGRSGDSYMVSYRDPNLENTISVYEKAAAYIAGIELDDRKILQFIIGTLSDLDAPLSPSAKGSLGLKAYLTGMTDEDYQKERDEILNVNEGIIRGLSVYLDAVFKEDYLCVVGNSDNIKKAKDRFMNVLPLI